MKSNADHSASGPVGPLVIDWIDLPCGESIGMTHCPGRQGRDMHGRLWQRELQHDLDALAAANVAALVTLIEEHEFIKLGVSALPTDASERFDWFHFPIADLEVPGTDAIERWQHAMARLVQILNSGQRVVFHCAAGLGRTGAVVAKLLVDRYGLSPDAAIELVRLTRPGTIESPSQEAFVRSPVCLWQAMIGPDGIAGPDQGTA